MRVAPESLKEAVLLMFRDYHENRFESDERYIS